MFYQGVTEGRFYAWRRRLTGRVQGAAQRRGQAAGTGATFALVQEAAGTPEPAGVALVWMNGRWLRIEPGEGAAIPQTVLAVLEPTRC